MLSAVQFCAISQKWQGLGRGAGRCFSGGKWSVHRQAALPGQVRGARGLGPLLMKYQYIKKKKNHCNVSPCRTREVDLNSKVYSRGLEWEAIFPFHNSGEVRTKHL